MKRFFLVLIAGLFLSGCGTLAQESEFWQHPTMYKNWEHMKFSLWGYQNPSKETAKKSQEQGWWGIPEYVDPE